jgi:hypothetical protein
VRAELPPLLATALQFNLGEGYQRFGKFEQARSHLQRAYMMAGEHRLNKVLFASETLLEQLETTPPPLRSSSPVPLDLEEVATVIREMRESVGTA